MFNLFKKKKTLAELETEKDILLYTLDWMLAMGVIDVMEYNNLLTKSLPYMRGE